MVVTATKPQEIHVCRECKAKPKDDYYHPIDYGSCQQGGLSPSPTIISDALVGRLSWTDPIQAMPTMNSLGPILLVVKSYIHAWSRSLNTMQSRNGTFFGSGNSGKKALLPISSVTKTTKPLSDLNVDYPVEEDHWRTWGVVLDTNLNT